MSYLPHSDPIDHIGSHTDGVASLANTYDLAMSYSFVISQYTLLVQMHTVIQYLLWHYFATLMTLEVIESWQMDLYLILNVDDFTVIVH